MRTVWRVSKYMFRYRGLFLLTMLLAVLSVAAMLAVPQVVQLHPAKRDGAGRAGPAVEGVGRDCAALRRAVCLQPPAHPRQQHARAKGAARSAQRRAHAAARAADVVLRPAQIGRDFLAGGGRRGERRARAARRHRAGPDRRADHRGHQRDSLGEKSAAGAVRGLAAAGVIRLGH